MNKESKWTILMAVAIITGSSYFHNNAFNDILKNSDTINFATATATTTTTTTTTTNTSTMHTRRRLINDPTLYWDETAYRPWLDVISSSSSPLKEQQQQLPPAIMILLTNVGWNHPNTSVGITFSRSIRETDFFTALVNHSWFHPTAWEDFQSGKLKITNDGTTRYYVFADVMTCPDKNYPLYGGTLKNIDSSYNRTVDHLVRIDQCGDGASRIIQKNPRLFQQRRLEKAKRKQRNKNRKLDNKSTTTINNNNTDADADAGGIGGGGAKLIVFDCRGTSPTEACRNRAPSPVAFAMLSGSLSNIKEDRDQGLIPPPNHPVRLTEQQEDNIRTCVAETSRRFHMVYMGNYRSGKHSKQFHQQHGGARGPYRKFHDNNRTIVLRYFDEKELHKSIVANMSYVDILAETEFGLTPRGDNKFSYRFTEVLSAGAIPVFHGDNYVFPFRPEVMDWNHCAVILPEKDAGQTTVDYIRKLTTKERCTMRNYCYFGIYKKYVATELGQLNGLIAGWEELAQGKRKPFAGVRCNATSIKNLDCNPL